MSIYVRNLEKIAEKIVENFRKLKFQNFFKPKVLEINLIFPNKIYVRTEHIP